MHLKQLFQAAISCLSFAALPSFAQQKKNTESVAISFGTSKHFSGDLSGFFVSAEYSKRANSKFNYHFALTTTIHSDVDQLFYTFPGSGTAVDGSIRAVTAGVQLESLLGYGIVNNLSNDLSVNLGPVLRFQSSSLPNMTNVTYPIVTGLPIPVINFQHTDPMKTLALGAVLQLRYQYHFTAKFSVGLLAAYQLDTNSDNLSRLGLTVARRF